MNEDYSTREWADNHASLGEGIRNLLHTISESLEKLNEKQFEAPWRQGACQNECAGH